MAAAFVAFAPAAALARCLAATAMAAAAGKMERVCVWTSLELLQLHTTIDKTISAIGAEKERL